MSGRDELRDDWQVPLPGRIGSRDDIRAEILARHADAIERGMVTYADPVSGFSVFTAAFLARRGYCCGSGCRHCPFTI